MAFSPDGTQILSCSYDGTTRLWNAETGREIVSFISFIDDEWIIITPDGYYNSSPKGDQYLNVRIGNAVYGMDQFSKIFYKPDVVERRLQGIPDPDDFISGYNITTASVPPALEVSVDQFDPETRQVNLSVTAIDKINQINDIRIINNGRLVGGNELVQFRQKQNDNLDVELTRFVPSTNDNTFEFTIPLELEGGLNRIEVIASSNLNYGIGFKDIPVSQGGEEKKSNLWLLAVGVNNYLPNASYENLSFPEKDTQRIVSSFMEQEGKGKRYDKVNVRVLSDNAKLKPVKQEILFNMYDFWKDAEQNDIIALFMSGHGKTENEVYYFLPADTQFLPDKKFNIESAISIDEISQALDRPGRKILMIDSCESGGADNNQLVHTLRNRSTVIFTASQQNQNAYENSLYGGGFFTTGFTEAMAGKAAQNGVVLINALEKYITDRVGDISKSTQRPAAIVPNGYRDFIISIIVPKP